MVIAPWWNLFDILHNFQSSNLCMDKSHLWLFVWVKVCNDLAENWLTTAISSRVIALKNSWLCAKIFVLVDISESLSRVILGDSLASYIFYNVEGGGVGEVITHKSFKLQRQIDSVTQGSRSKDESGRELGKGVATELGYCKGLGYSGVLDFQICCHRQVLSLLSWLTFFMFPFFVLENDNKTISNIDGNIKQRR